MHIDDLCVKFDKEYGNQGSSEFIWHLYDPAKDDRLCLTVEMRIETMVDTDIVENLTLFEEHFLIVKNHNKKTKVMKMTGKDPLSDISHNYVSASEYGENTRVSEVERDFPKAAKVVEIPGGWYVFYNMEGYEIWKAWQESEEENSIAEKRS